LLRETARDDRLGRARTSPNDGLDAAHIGVFGED
jgi:hypothetical protein